MLFDDPWQGREIDSFFNGFLIGVYRYRIDADLLWRHLYGGAPSAEALGVFGKGFIKRSLSHLGDFNVLSGKYLLRCKAAQSTVVMLIVVPADIVLTPEHGVLVVIESPRIVRLVFHGFELSLTEGVIVADTWPTVAGSDCQLTKQIQVTFA